MMSDEVSHGTEIKDVCLILFSLTGMVLRKHQVFTGEFGTPPWPFYCDVKKHNTPSGITKFDEFEVCLFLYHGAELNASLTGAARRLQTVGMEDASVQGWSGNLPMMNQIYPLCMVILTRICSHSFNYWGEMRKALSD